MVDDNTPSPIMPTLLIFKPIQAHTDSDYTNIQNTTTPPILIPTLRLPYKVRHQLPEYDIPKDYDTNTPNMTKP